MEAMDGDGDDITRDTRSVLNRDGDTAAKVGE